MNKKEKITVTLKNYNRSLNKGWIGDNLTFESLTEAEQWLKKEGYELFECRMEKNNYYYIPIITCSPTSIFISSIGWTHKQ